MAIFRKFIDSDALDLIAALREAYGEDYSPKYMYDEQLLCKACQCNIISLTVATTESGEFIGMIGLKRVDYFLATVEVTGLVVREKFRELHIASQLFAECMRIADSEDVPSNYGEVAMTSDFSQRIMAKLGYRATGLWLNRKAIPGHIKVAKSIKTDKLNLIIAVRNHNITDAGIVYLPQKYVELAEGCYKQFGVKVAVVTESNEPIMGKTIFTEISTEDYFNTNVFVYEAGEDFAAVLGKASILDNNLSTVSVLIDIKKPTALRAIEKLESVGYKFCGFLPLASEYEYAVFHLYHCEIDSDELVICDAFGYVKGILGEL